MKIHGRRRAVAPRMQCRKKGDKFFCDFWQEFFWRTGFIVPSKRAKSPLRINVRLAAGDAPALQFSDLQPSPRLRLGKLIAGLQPLPRLRPGKLTSDFWSLSSDVYPRNGSTIIASSGRRRLDGTLAISARASSLRPAAARTEACTATAEAETALLGTFKLA